VEKIELLDVSLLNDNIKLKEIDRWLKVLNWNNGWHYDLDIIWTLRNLETLNIPPGATIIDAGAGLGVMQFILAARGYNVISLDFAERKIPKYAEGNFNIECIDRDLGDYTHEYMEFMTFGQRPAKQVSIPITSKIKAYIKQPSKIIYRISSSVRRRHNPHYLRELRCDHAGYGKITFLRGIFNDMPIEDNTAAALISISAFEHNTFEDMAGSVVEFNRVIKPGAHMIVTTSAAKERDWYYEPSKGWNFTRQTLSKWFGITDDVSFDYEPTFMRIRSSNKMRKRISPYYRYSTQCGLPYAKLEDARYCPVGIIRAKM
jgi:ubiquinone/menaquinone biosynthesis C-methylase UbiE